MERDRALIEWSAPDVEDGRPQLYEVLYGNWRVDPRLGWTPLLPGEALPARREDRASLAVTNQTGGMPSYVAHFPDMPALRAFIQHSMRGTILSEVNT